MKRTNKSYKVFVVTLTLMIKSGNKLLIGKIIGGPIDGFVTAPGGKVERKDKNIHKASDREIREETGLKCNDSHEVAIVTINIPGKRRIIRIHVFKCTKWAGKRLRINRNEFHWLKFLRISESIYSQMPPGDSEWVRRLIKGERLAVNILCGEDRIDLREIHIKVLP